MTNFVSFANRIAAHLAVMQKSELFTAAIEKDAIWDAYLAAFPEGTNPIFRVRTEHDGSYDRNFIKNLGRVLSIVDGALVSVWDSCDDLPHPYNVVAGKLSALVREAGCFGQRASGAATGSGQTHHRGQTRRSGQGHQGSSKASGASATAGSSGPQQAERAGWLVAGRNPKAT